MTTSCPSASSDFPQQNEWTHVKRAQVKVAKIWGRTPAASGRGDNLRSKAKGFKWQPSGLATSCNTLSKKKHIVTCQTLKLIQTVNSEGNKPRPNIWAGMAFKTHSSVYRELDLKNSTFWQTRLQIPRNPQVFRTQMKQAGPESSKTTLSEFGLLILRFRVRLVPRHKTLSKTMAASWNHLHLLCWNEFNHNWIQFRNICEEFGPVAHGHCEHLPQLSTMLSLSLGCVTVSAVEPLWLLWLLPSMTPSISYAK